MNFTHRAPILIDGMELGVLLVVGEPAVENGVAVSNVSISAMHFNAWALDVELPQWLHYSFQDLSEIVCVSRAVGIVGFAVPGDKF